MGKGYVCFIAAATLVAFLTIALTDVEYYVRVWAIVGMIVCIIASLVAVVNTETIKEKLK